MLEHYTDTYLSLAISLPLSRGGVWPTSILQIATIDRLIDVKLYPPYDTPT